MRLRIIWINDESLLQMPHCLIGMARADQHGPERQMRAFCRRRVIGVRLQDRLKVLSGFGRGVSSEGVKSQVEMCRPTSGITLQNGAITGHLIDEHTRVCGGEGGEREQDCERANITE